VEEITEWNLFLDMRDRYDRNELNLKQTSKEMGYSYSKTSKYFGGDKSFSDEYILEHKLMPVWVQNEGERRKWPILEIVKWLRRTEKNGSK